MTRHTMSDESIHQPAPEAAQGDAECTGRRDFLIGLGRWSKAVIGAALLGGLALPGAEAEAGWANRRGGGGWANRRGGGGWANGRYGQGGTWANRNGGWVNGGGGTWANRNGGWVNRRPGGTWANVR